MHTKTTILLGLFLLVFFNCKSVKPLGEGASNYKLSTKALIKANKSKAANFKTLKAKLKVTYTKKGKSQTHSLNLRLKHNQSIWINATFSLIRALVTPQKVSFYNKLDNTFFEGDYKYLSDLLGTELNFEKVQNIILGETLYPLKDGDYKAKVDNDLYVVQPKRQSDFFEIFFLLDASNFKVKSQQLTQPKQFKHLQIDYLKYQDVEDQILPEQLKVIALHIEEEIIVEVEMKNVFLNEELRFPFTIPDGFKEIKFP